MSEQFKMTWEKATEEKFKRMLAKMPIFHRHMTEVAATQKAESNAKARGSRVVEEVDLMLAMFSEVPLQFYSLMIRLLDDVGFDYKKHNLPRIY
ncbi:MAG: hypothetical protein AUJ74_01510 [Candidatus Omnitrophica bacterium CG1_02_44_16]|nr:MAG: hypothetical protein AUJ74_01510 [Candidatus Omnitrophica bacterium CG1_02_44_16]PIY82505.1 MAG: hypothetical protein COY78_06640 [Candidatus Omnitrophica bacterium CG_4_10_14_0_8_um_filter_44_12]PIZ84622.1 MAG: hypothetical protein COX96_02960 [Candidatus Omnitrophica bacterium CG_4_10_14_0_2_um_filter_44_9]